MQFKYFCIHFIKQRTKGVINVVTSVKMGQHKVNRRPWPTGGCCAMGKKTSRQKKDTPKEKTNGHTWLLNTGFFYCFAGKPKLHVLPRSKHNAYTLERRTSSHKHCSSRKSHETHKHSLRQYIGRQLRCALIGKFLEYISIVFYCTDKLLWKELNMTINK